MEVGVLLDADILGPDELVTLATFADEKGIQAAIVTGKRHADAWSVASWITGVTTRIRVGVPALRDAYDPTDADGAVPSVVDKATVTLAALAPDRTLPPDARWTVVDPDIDAESLIQASHEGLPVVRVQTLADVERASSLAAIPNPDVPPGHRQRTILAKSRRVADIDYDGVPASLAGLAVEPGDPEYDGVSSTYLRGGSPGLVLRPRTVEEVADALSFAQAHRHVPLGVRSAGHGISGRSTNRNGLIISVGAMNDLVVLDEQRRLVRIGPGRTWKQVAQALAPYGWALGSGDYGGVGVGGLATAGGIGLLSRKHGLTIDHLRAVELVLADGTPIRASNTENPDLFWAIRGAGANFGIATAFEFETSVVGNVGWAQLTLISSDIEESIYQYGQLASSAPRDTTVFFVSGRARGGQWAISLFAVVDNPDPDVVVERLTPFLEIGALVQQQVVMTPYAGVMDNAVDIGPEGQQGYGEPVSRSAFLPVISRELAREFAALLSSGVVYFFELRGMGGAINEVSPDAMAFSHRSAGFQVAAMSAREDDLQERWFRLRPHFDGLYLSFETDRSPERLGEAFPEPVLERLRRLKAEYDPTNLFHDNFNITPTLAPVADDAA